MKRTYTWLLAAVAIAVTSAPAAAQEPPTSTVTPEVEEAYVYETNSQGKRIGPRIKLSREELERHRADARELAVGPGKPRAAARRAQTGRLQLIPLSSGCRGVDVARVGRSLLGTVTYKFWQHKDWCWTYPRVTSALSHYFLTDVAATFYFRGLIGSWGDFYSWCCGVWNSGHIGFRQGQFENCVLRYGCVRSEYPWVRIYGHADGSWSYSTGL